MKANELSVLVIEEDPEWEELIRISLKKNGVDKIDITVDGLKALKLSHKNYDVVICNTKKNNTLFGPYIIKAINNIGKYPVVVALLMDPEDRKYWGRWVYCCGKLSFCKSYSSYFLKDIFNLD